MNASEIKVTFTLDQVNALLSRLGQLPYSQVADLIEAIKGVAAPQIPVDEEAQDQKEAA